MANHFENKNLYPRIVNALWGKYSIQAKAYSNNKGITVYINDKVFKTTEEIITSGSKKYINGISIKEDHDYEWKESDTFVSYYTKDIVNEFSVFIHTEEYKDVDKKLDKERFEYTNSAWDIIPADCSFSDFVELVIDGIHVSLDSLDRFN